MVTKNKSIIFAALICLAMCGCATRTVVLDSSHDIVRLGADVRGHIYVWNAGHHAWELTGPVTLPEGWFAGPMEAK
jgi:hypothetical protein